MWNNCSKRIDLLIGYASCPGKKLPGEPDCCQQFILPFGKDPAPLGITQNTCEFTDIISTKFYQIHWCSLDGWATADRNMQSQTQTPCRSLLATPGQSAVTTRDAVSWPVPDKRRISTNQ